MNSTKRHSWTMEDDILVFYHYRYPDDEILSVEIIAGRMPETNKQGSVKMRLSNFASLEPNGRTSPLEHYAELSAVIYNKYKDVSQDEHRTKCKEILVS